MERSSTTKQPAARSRRAPASRTRSMLNPAGKIATRALALPPLKTAGKIATRALALPPLKTAGKIATRASLQSCHR